MPLAGVELLCRLCIAMPCIEKLRIEDVWGQHWDSIGTALLMLLEPRSQGLSSLPAPPSSKRKPDVDAAIGLYTFVSDLSPL